MPHNNKGSIRCIALLLAAAVIAALMLAACAKKDEIVVPEGLSREEAALYTAVAKVCPKDKNHSKADYLTFHIEGWSFGEIPAPLLQYLSEYCASGNATMLQFDRDKLVELGYIAKGEADTFYENDVEVYAEGRGKIFKFILRDGQSTDSDTCVVAVEEFISTHDSNGKDIVLSFENGKWQFVRYENAWNAYQFETEDPNATTVPQK